MTELADFWTDLDAIEAEKWKWLEGPRITFDDVNNGSARVQKCTAREWFNPKSADKGSDGGRSPSNTMGFGAHRDRLMVDVKEEMPDYWRWATQNVDWFAAKARKAGLLDDTDAE